MLARISGLTNQIFVLWKKNRMKKESDEKRVWRKKVWRKNVWRKKRLTRKKSSVKKKSNEKSSQKKRSSMKKKKEFGGFVCQDDTWICFMLLKLKFQIKTPSTICGYSNLTMCILITEMQYHLSYHCNWLNQQNKRHNLQ